MTYSEKVGEKIIILFAVIGVIAILSFVPTLFSKEKDTDNVCGAYTSKIEDLESEIETLKDEYEALDNYTYEVERTLEEVVEEHNSCMEYYEEKEGIEYPKLTDGPSREN